MVRQKKEDVAALFTFLMNSSHISPTETKDTQVKIRSLRYYSNGGKMAA